MELSGYEIYQMVSRGAGPEGLTEAADVSRDARTRIQALGDELRGLTGQLQGLWQGRASDRAAQAVQPIEQSLQRAQETLDRADAALRTQAQSYGRLRQQVQPMATPYPPELTLFDEITPWDTDNELARKAWFEADAHNRRVYAEYVGLTGQNQAMLPQAPGASGGAPGADTAVGSSGGAGVRSGTPAPPQVGDGGGGTSPSSAGGPAAGGGSSPGSAGGDKPSASPSAGGGGRTSASEVGGGDGGGSPRPPAVAGPTAPRQPGDRTAVADWAAGVPGGLPAATRPPAGRDTGHTSKVPKGDHLSGGGGVAPVLPGGIGIGDPTGTRGQRGSLDAGDRSAVLGRTPGNAPAAAGARGAAGRVGTGVAGMGGFAPHAPATRDEDDREHRRTVYLDEDADALVGRLPGGVAPVIGED